MGVCQNFPCQRTDEFAGKCAFCKGTGYLFEGFDSKPEWNDGTTNVPKEGDVIRCVGTQSRYTYHDKPSGYQVTRESELLEDSRTESLEKLENLYKKYKEEYYTAKKYKKLTKIYNKAIKKVKKSQDREELLDTCYAALSDMKNIQPSVLRKYQIKLDNKMREAVYEYTVKCEKTGQTSLIGDVELKLGEYLTLVSECKTKSKAKKTKNEFLEWLETVPQPS